MLCHFKNVFSQQAFSHAISICTFQECQNRTDLQLSALKYLFTHRNKRKDCPKLIKVSFEMIERYQKAKDLSSIKEVVDIVNTFSPQHGKILLDFLRQQKQQKQEQKQTRQPIQKTVYSDSQNVHNSKINKTVISTAEKLYEKFSDIINIDNENKKNCLENIRLHLVKKFPHETELVNSSVEYIKSNTSYFGVKKITLLDIFLSVWLWIINNGNINELEKRLVEELKQMEGECTTGHVARFINVIQGFTNDSDLCIQISNEDRYKGVIFYYLTNELKNCEDEDIINDIVNTGPKYKKFIQDKIVSKFPEWKKNNIDDIQLIINLTNSFAKTKIF